MKSYSLPNIRIEHSSIRHESINNSTWSTTSSPFRVRRVHCLRGENDSHHNDTSGRMDTNSTTTTNNGVWDVTTTHSAAMSSVKRDSARQRMDRNRLINVLDQALSIVNDDPDLLTTSSHAFMEHDNHRSLRSIREGQSCYPHGRRPDDSNESKQ